MAVVIGVELGQQKKPSALCVAGAERRWVPDKEEKETHFLIRHLERLPLGSSFPEVASRLDEVARGAARHSTSEKPLPGWGPPRTYVNATGLGEAVIEVLRGPSTEILAVYFNHGDRRLEESRTEVKLGKAYLVARLQALLQTRQLHLPNTAEAETLAKELLDYEIRVTEDANDRYGAFRVGRNDDLITALGLAVHAEPNWPRPPLRLVIGSYS
ncbi:MAG: hypothetical protein K0U98_05900 [Deltaproteobacteria bacterium]|nr:hypothetical protein [Deltaproteobacteria bacterium]